MTGAEKENVLEQKVDWLTAMEVKIKLDQAEAKANDAGSGPYFCVAAAASETCVALARCGCTDLRLGRAFYRRRCGTRASEMRGVKFDQCGKAKQTLHQCRPDASSA